MGKKRNRKAGKGKKPTKSKGKGTPNRKGTPHRNKVVLFDVDQGQL